jgi:hypothetical protein
LIGEYIGVQFTVAINIRPASMLGLAARERRMIWCLAILEGVRH